MGFAYLGIGVGGAIAPLLSHRLAQQFGWQGALRTLGILVVLIALPMAFFIKENPSKETDKVTSAEPMSIGRVLKSWQFYFWLLGACARSAQWVEHFRTSNSS